MCFLHAHEYVYVHIYKCSKHLKHLERAVLLMMLFIQSKDQDRLDHFEADTASRSRCTRRPRERSLLGHVWWLFVAEGAQHHQRSSSSKDPEQL